MKALPPLRWITAALIVASLAGCQKKPAPIPAEPTPPVAAPKIVSAEPTSFEAVTRNLDPGGRAFCYFSTEALIKTLSEKWTDAGPLLFAAVTGKLDDAARAKAQGLWNATTAMAAKCGLAEVTGVGTSTIALEPNYFQTKWMVHHARGKGEGVIWKIGGSTPNSLDFIGYLPEKTALASSGNLKLKPIWDALVDEGKRNPELQQQLDQAASQFQLAASGLELPSLLASLGPNYSVALALDESRPVTLPMPGASAPISFAEPALAIFVQVQDDVLIRRIEEQLSKNPQAVKSEEEGLTLYVISLPIPLGFLRPAIGWKQGQLILASNDAVIREMMAVKAGKKPGLAASAGFQKLRSGMPETGCKFSYASPVFFDTMNRLQRAQLETGTGSNEPLARLMLYFNRITPPQTIFGMHWETDEGWLGMSRQKIGSAEAAK